MFESFRPDFVGFGQCFAEPEFGFPTPAVPRVLWDTIKIRAVPVPPACRQLSITLVAWLRAHCKEEKSGSGDLADIELAASPISSSKWRRNTTSEPSKRVRWVIPLLRNHAAWDLLLEYPVISASSSRVSKIRCLSFTSFPIQFIVATGGKIHKKQPHQEPAY